MRAGGKRYSKTYHKDQDGHLIAKGGGTRRKLEKIVYPHNRRGWFLGFAPLPEIRGQRPPGIPTFCLKHKGGDRHKGCPDCAKGMRAEQNAINEFQRVAGFTNLPKGAAAGKYDRNHPLEKTGSTYTVTSARTKKARDGSLRLMANDVWHCCVCDTLWLNTTKVCATCGQPQNRRKPIKAALKRWEARMIECERCGFNHLPPASSKCVRCHWVLGTKCPKKDREAWAAKDAEAKAKVNTAHADKLAAHAAETKEAKMAKAKTGKEIFGREMDWWQAKPGRYAILLLLQNAHAKPKDKKTDDEIFAEVNRLHPGQRTLTSVNGVGWYRSCLLGKFASSPRPKYVPEDAEIPPRYWRDGKGKITTEKPAKPKPEAPAKAKPKKAASKKAASKKAASKKAAKPKPKKKAAAKKPAKPKKKAAAKAKGTARGKKVSK